MGASAGDNETQTSTHRNDEDIEIDLEARGDPQIVMGANEDLEAAHRTSTSEHASYKSSHRHSRSLQRDEEASTHEKSEGGEGQVDSNVIGWDGPDDPANPRNFPIRRKWLLTFLCG